MYFNENTMSSKKMAKIALCFFILSVSACGGGSDGSDDSDGALSGLEITKSEFRSGITGCHLVVTARNTTNQRKTAYLYFEAYNRSGQAIGYAFTSQFYVAPNSTQTTSSKYEHTFTSNSGGFFRTCSSISSIRFVKSRSIVS